jgi:hypothetical protein
MDAHFEALDARDNPLGIGSISPIFKEKPRSTKSHETTLNSIREILS